MISQAHVLHYIFVVFLTGNNRSALNDATAARKFQPTYMKAILRGGYVDL